MIILFFGILIVAVAWQQSGPWRIRLLMLGVACLFFALGLLVGVWLYLDDDQAPQRWMEEPNQVALLGIIELVDPS